jgi:hypothetical protein
VPAAATVKPHRSGGHTGGSRKLCRAALAPAQQLGRVRNAAAEVEQLGRIARDLPRFPLARRLCHELLRARDGLVVRDMSAWWLDDIVEVVDSRTTDLEKASLTSLLGSFVQEIHKLAREQNPPPRRTGPAKCSRWPLSSSIARARRSPSRQHAPKPGPRTAATTPHQRRALRGLNRALSIS